MPEFTGTGMTRKNGGRDAEAVVRPVLFSLRRSDA
jgi:hypothetical protein